MDKIFSESTNSLPTTTNSLEDIRTTNYKKWQLYSYRLLVIGAIILAIGIVINWFNLIKVGNSDGGIRQGDIANQSAQLKTWINCNDVRDAVEDNGKIYVACLGGVMVVNKDTGEILDEINIEDGLLSDTITDLLLINNNLYIGSQGGVDIYNFQTGYHDQISTRSGLPSNYNIRLAYDNENVWIGTFKGLARLNQATGNIDTFTDEIPVDNSQVNIQTILVTDKAVYAYANSNAYTKGYIARYDKQLKTWSNWGGRDLNSVFLLGLSEFDGKIYVYTNETVYTANDTVDSKLSQSKVGTKDSSYRYLGSYGEYSFSYKQNSIYSYNLKTGETVKLASNVDFGQNGPIVNKSIYTFPLDGNKPWLVEYDGMTGLAKTLSLNRPSSFLGIHGSINSEVFVGTNRGLYLIDFSGKNLNFSSENLVTSFTNFDPNFQIIQIPNSNKFGFFSQNCDMTCGKAQFIIYDYLEHTSRSDNPPSDILPEVNTPYDTSLLLSYIGTDDKNKLIFNNSSQNFDVKWFSYDPESGWKTEDTQPNIVLKYEKQNCAPTFKYDLQQKLIRSEAIDCDKDQLSHLFPDGIASLLRLQDGYVGVYTWGGLFSYMPNLINEKK